MLNLPGGTQTAPGAPPRLMSLTETMAAAGTVAAPAPRSRSAVYILGLLGVIGVIVVLVGVNLKKPPRPAATIVQPPPRERDARTDRREPRRAAAADRPGHRADAAAAAPARASAARSRRARS